MHTDKSWIDDGWEDVDDHLSRRKTRGELIGYGLLALAGYGLYYLINTRLEKKQDNNPQTGGR